MRFLILILHTHTAHSNDWKYYKYRLQLSQMHSWGDTPRQARETSDTCVSYNIFPRWRFIATTRRRSRSRQTCLRSSAMAGPPCGARARTGGRRCAWRGAARTADDLTTQLSCDGSPQRSSRRGRQQSGMSASGSVAPMGSSPEPGSGTIEAHSGLLRPKQSGSKRPLPFPSTVTSARHHVQRASEVIWALCSTPACSEPCMWPTGAAETPPLLLPQRPRPPHGTCGCLR